MKTKSGILDKFQPTLNPVIWDGSKMKDDFRIAVEDVVKSNCSDNGLELKGILIYGGNAGYQYGPNSDIDISVYIDWEQTNPEKYEELAENFRNEKFLYDGIEVHFMLKNPEERELVEANENVYNILEDKWLQEPAKHDFDPKEEFASLIAKALTFKDKLIKAYDEVEKEAKELKNAGVISIPDGSLTSLKTLIGIVAQVRKNRDIEHQELRKKAIKHERITLFDRATENEFVWKTIADLPMTQTLKELSYKEGVL